MYISLIAGAVLSAKVSLSWAFPTDLTERPSITVDATSVESGKTIHGSGDLELEPGQWFIRASAPGFWAEETLIHVRADSTTRTYFSFERAATITGRASFESRTLPREAVVHFQRLTLEGSHSARCPIAKGRITCVVPLGTHDLSFRVEGFASVYRWDTEVNASGADLGTLVFRRGSTLSGRVENPADGTQIVVAPTPRDAFSEDVQPQLSLRATRAPVDRLGRFALHLEPGAYRVRAQAGALRSEERDVLVGDGREAALVRTLVLEPPRQLTIAVHPPLDPWQRAWEVTVGRAHSFTDNSGNATFEVHSGSHDVEVRSGASTWFAAETLVEADRTIDAVISDVTLRGNVTIGDEPLGSAWITFVNGAVRVRARAASTGVYGVRLPQNADDTWDRVEIKGGDIAAVLRNVHAEREENGELRLDLTVPATKVTGNVTTRGGTAADALVTIQGSGGFLSQLETSGGAFVIRGLSPDSYQITAAGKAGSTMRPYDLLLDKAEAAQVSLEIAPAPQLRGTVVSPFGSIAGADIFATRTGDTPRLIAPIRTDAAGNFDIRLPVGTEDVTIVAHAPGYALRILRMRVENKAVQIALMPQGGALRLDASNGGFLIHDTAVVPVDLLTYLAPGRMDGRVFEIPIAEEGSYALCRAPIVDDRCERAMLARYGSVTLN